MPDVRRTTVYLEPDLRRALRLKSAATDRSVSDLVNSAVREALAEDLDDARALDERSGEPVRPFEDFLRELRDAGKV